MPGDAIIALRLTEVGCFLPPPPLGSFPATTLSEIIRRGAAGRRRQLVMCAEHTRLIIQLSRRGPIHTKEERQQVLQPSKQSLLCMGPHFFLLDHSPPNAGRQLISS